ncbi:Thyrotroph embryonic factor, putative [Pediculus humanus corporis]|uniref:Thyrotroph embryonic factor, putative n=1 Tax=Pediculus humanus subsp. corporis TaxID=121224 RepID=E0VPK1_PEDHC|nr:Thyrotroph embryonic factor, putative [Pediculus humanus corporis]EEB15307.1 Thyrotroph embryonic factor, putative [Pediculus humanus corporis]
MAAEIIVDVGSSSSNLVQVYHHYSCRSSSSPSSPSSPSPSFGSIAPEIIPQTNNFTFSPISIGHFNPYNYYPIPAVSPPSLNDYKTRQQQSFLNPSSIYGRRPRGEKKPIPDDQKDDRYYERRKRNNQAAKKSRDARKFREDQIALRATLLEHENAVLRAQILTLREETRNLREKIIYNKCVRTEHVIVVVCSSTFKNIVC